MQQGSVTCKPQINRCIPKHVSHLDGRCHIDYLPELFLLLLLRLLQRIPSMTTTTSSRGTNSRSKAVGCPASPCWGRRHWRQPLNRATPSGAAEGHSLWPGSRLSFGSTLPSSQIRIFLEFYIMSISCTPISAAPPKNASCEQQDFLNFSTEVPEDRNLDAHRGFSGGPERQ